jgi:CDP-6-deoxy-D-xylo-4-hexulose-3-dehydrase
MFEHMRKDEAFRYILDRVEEYHRMYIAPKSSFREGDRIPYAGRVFDHREMGNLVESSLEFWLTAGRFADEFERKFAAYLGVRHCSLVNSGSSANLLAFMALTSPLLGDRAIRRGDEVITVAAGFPTTVAPIVQFGAVPVFVDVTIPQYNVDVSRLEAAVTLKTKAVMLAHTLGNPFDIEFVKRFCEKHRLWLVEDNCDALGSEYTYRGKLRLSGTVGDIGTSSFYPPHHMTMGEGGAVYTDDLLLHKIIRSLRDWGRDCVCPSGTDGMCGQRFSGQYGTLPIGYDHKYVYSHFGYNLKATDMQAAIGVAQLDKLPSFVEQRRRNFQSLKEGISAMTDMFVLPEAASGSDPSWFGFLLTCRDGVDRSRIVSLLEGHNIQTRMLFAGNLIKHPCFDAMRRSGEGFRVVGDLTNTDRIMNDTFWVGVYPGMTEEMIAYVVRMIGEAGRLGRAEKVDTCGSKGESRHG